MAAPDTYRLRAGNPKTQVFPKDTTTTVIKVGDMLKIASGKVSPATATTDNVAFRGVAMTASDAGTADTVTVGLPTDDAEWDFVLDAATTMAVDDYVQIDNTNSDAQTVKKVSGTTDPVGVCTLAGASLTVARIKFLMPERYLGDAS